MRACCIVISCVMAACTSSSPSYQIPPKTDPDRVITLSCDSSVAEFCRDHDCDPTLDDAEHNPALCRSGAPPSLTVCGDYAVVNSPGIDTSVASYYRDGKLAGIVFSGLPLPTRCNAGPSSFEAPQCDHAERAPLAACQ